MTSAINPAYPEAVNATTESVRDNFQATKEEIEALQAAVDLIGSGIILGAPVDSTSGTSISFSSIPVGAKRVTLNYNGLSTNGTSLIIVQLGTSGGPKTSGYTGTVETGGSRGSFTDGMKLTQVGSALWSLDGSLVFTLLNAITNLWVCQGVSSGNNSAAASHSISGAVALSAALDRIIVTTQGGTDTFDAGKLNIAFET
jgi:hypothetical protein